MLAATNHPNVVASADVCPGGPCVAACLTGIAGGYDPTAGRDRMDPTDGPSRSGEAQ